MKLVWTVIIAILWLTMCCADSEPPPFKPGDIVFLKIEPERQMVVGMIFGHVHVS